LNFIRKILNLALKSTGEIGEDEAVRFLKKAGFKILERNFSCKSGELDVIAEDGDAVVFVEVKTRSSTSHGRASEFVDSKKQERIIKTAYVYLQGEYGDDLPHVRFDIVEVYKDGDKYSCEIIKDAFGAEW